MTRMKSIPLLALVVLAVIQWLVPGNIILKREKILKEGEIFKFLTEPIDPSDPFLGRYVHLNFKEKEFTRPRDLTAENIQTYTQAYVLLDKEKDGFAKIKNIQLTKPADHTSYVKAVVWSRSMEGDSINFFITYPFENFYMDEFMAPKAEEAFRRRQGDSTKKTYAVVSVLNGESVIKEVMIGDKPIRELLTK